MSSNEFWLGKPILNCFLDFFRRVQARLINAYNRDFDEEDLTALLVESFEDDHELKECVKNKRLPFTNQFILNISVRKEIRRWESKETGIDLAISFDIDIPPKKVSKSILIQAKILRKENATDVLTNLVDKTFKKQLAHLSDYPERAAYILWYGPPKLKIPGRQNKDFGPRIMPVTSFKHYNENPTMFHLLSDSYPLDEFLAVNGLRTDAGSENSYVNKIASGEFILEKRQDDNVRIGAKGLIEIIIKGIREKSEK